MAIPSDTSAINKYGIYTEIKDGAYVAVTPDEPATVDLSAYFQSKTLNTNSTGYANKFGNHDGFTNGVYDGTSELDLSLFGSYDHDAAAPTFDAKSFDLDGANDYLTGPGALSAIAALEQVGSVSVWVKLDSMSSNGVIWQITAEEGTANQLFILWHNASGVIRGNVKLGNSANLVDSGSGLENDGNWHHICMTWIANQRSGNIVRMYVDGSQTDTDAISTTWSDASPPAHFTIGRNQIQSNAYFNGHVNDFAIFSDVLTASEVSSIYNSGEAKNESSHSGLVAYFTLEGYSDGDSTVADDSNNSNALTINNSSNIDSTDTP